MSSISDFSPYRKGDRKLALNALGAMGVLDKNERRSDELSSDERRRVVIARAFAQGSHCILLDEPTNHLNIRYQHEILELLRDLGRTVVIVPRDLNMAARCCDRIHILSAGRMRSVSAAEQILLESTVAELYGVNVSRIDHRGEPQFPFISPTRQKGNSMTLKPLFLTATTYATLVLAGCSTDTGAAQEHSTPAFPSSNSTYPVKASFCGREVTIKHEPQRIIGAGCEGVASIVSAGTADKMMARFGERGAQYGPRIENELNKLTGIEGVISAGGEEYGSIGFERILELRPDMVYGSTLGNGDLGIDNPEANGISAVIPSSGCAYAFADAASNFTNLDAIPTHVRELEALLDAAEKADMNAGTVEANLAEARAEGKKFPELVVASLYYWDSSGDLLTYDANSTIQGIFNTVHLKDVVTPTYDAMFNGAISPEAVVKPNPDVLIVTTGEGGIILEDSLVRLERVPGMTETTAFKNRRIIGLPSGAAYPTIGTTDTARELVKTLAGQ